MTYLQTRFVAAEGGIILERKGSEEKCAKNS